MLLLTAMIAVATTASEVQVEKKLPVVTEIQQEVVVTEETKSEELVLNDLLVLDDLEDASEEE